jgi:hypothetical protein
MEKPYPKNWWKLSKHKRKEKCDHSEAYWTEDIWGAWAVCKQCLNDVSDILEKPYWVK